MLVERYRWHSQWSYNVNTYMSTGKKQLCTFIQLNDTPMKIFATGIKQHVTNTRDIFHYYKVQSFIRKKQQQFDLSLLDDKKLQYIITELFPEMNIPEYLNFDWEESYSGEDVLEDECQRQENQQ